MALRTASSSVWVDVMCMRLCYAMGAIFMRINPTSLAGLTLVP